MDSDQLFNQILKEDVFRFWENLTYELSTLFLGPDALAIYTVLILVKLILWLRKED